jgi:hypothetical protein
MYVPNGQGRQAAAEVAPVLALYVPTGQDVTADAPTVATYLPAGASVQLTEPVAGA